MPKRNPLAEDNEYLRKKLQEMQTRRTWILLDHLCKECRGGRILECVTGNGMTPGGNPIMMCANCGASTTSLGCDICWCNYTFRNQDESAYMCLSYKAIDEYPKLLEEFRSCGSEPPPPWGTNSRAGSVGVVTHAGFRRVRNDLYR